MATVTMPQLGESVTEGTIGRWLKQPGDRVEMHEPLVEVITDKVNAEVPSPFAGTLTEILVEEGATVPTGGEIARLAADGEAPRVDSPVLPDVPAAVRAAVEDGATSGSATAVGRGTVRSDADGPTVSKPGQESPPSSGDGGHDGPARVAVPVAAELPVVGDADARMTPAVRRLLREHGLRPEQIPLAGPGRRITRDDVLAIVTGADTRPGAAAPATPASSTSPASVGTRGAAAAAPTAAALAAPPADIARGPAGPAVVFPDGADEVLVTATRMRQGIAAQMTRALAVPHAYVHVEVNASNLVALRQARKAEYQAQEGIPLSYVPFVVRAACLALRRHPTFNANWTDQGLLAKRRINIGVAIAVDDGLIVPVIRDADALSIHGLGRAIADLAARARTGKFRAGDFGGASFTIDNTGWFGSILTLPIINVPEVAILTMEAITRRPVVVDTPAGEAIAIRSVMNMVIGIDHRANDGAQAGAFLGDVKAWLEAVGPDTEIW